MENDNVNIPIEQQIDSHKKGVQFDIEDLNKRLTENKNLYNNKIKDYRLLEANLTQNEKNRCELLKKVCMLKKDQKLFLNSVTVEFIEHFRDIINRGPKEINDVIFINFLGFKVTPIKFIRKMLKDEKDVKNLFKEAVKTNSFNNKNNLSNSTLLIKKIDNLNKENNKNLEYPINIIIDFIKDSHEIYFLQEKAEILSNEFDNMQDQKNDIFISLKKMESEIMMNESLLRNLKKQNFILTEKINRTKLITDLKEKNLNFNEISTDISNFKRKSISSNNFNRKADTLNNLTLKSNYSDENDSSMVKRNELKNAIKKAPLTPEHNKAYMPDKSTHKKNETIDNIIDNLTRIKTEGNKFLLSSNNKKIEGKTIKLKSIKTNDKYFHNIQDVAQIISKGSAKNQNSLNQSTHLLSPINGSVNNSNLYKKDNKIKIKIENVVQKQPKKKSGTSTKNTKKGMTEINSATIINQNIDNNFQKFEKFFTESTKDNTFKKTKTKNSQTLTGNSLNKDIFSINNIECGGCLINSVKPNLLPIQTNSDVIDNINEEWIMSPMHKLNIKSSKLLSEKVKNELSQLKMDKTIVKNHGCCQSCV